MQSDNDERTSSAESEKSEKRKNEFLPLDGEEQDSDEAKSKRSADTIPDFARTDFVTYSQAPVDIMTR